MPSCNLERDVPYRADQMFDLVIDMEHYQDFMPIDFSGHIVEHGPNTLRTSQAIRIDHIPLTFDSTASFHRPDWIRVESTSKHFNYFLIAWTFIRLEHGCNVRVQVDCTTHSPPLGVLLAPWIETFSKVLITAFERRAKDMYGMAPAS